jgi:hypothetical protein
MTSGKAGDLSWKELLKTQNDDLKRLEAIDAELNDDAMTLDADIRIAMKKTSIASKISASGGARRLDLSVDRALPSRAPVRREAAMMYADDDDGDVGFVDNRAVYDHLDSEPKTSRSADNDGVESTGSGVLRGATPKAPDASLR